MPEMPRDYYNSYVSEIDWNHFEFDRKGKNITHTLTLVGTYSFDAPFSDNKIKIKNYDGKKHVVTAGDRESFVDVPNLGSDNMARQILYENYQFKNSTTAYLFGGSIWGGRSKIGNTTTPSPAAKSMAISTAAMPMAMAAAKPPITPSTSATAPTPSPKAISSSPMTTAMASSTAATRTMTSPATP